MGQYTGLAAQEIGDRAYGILIPKGGESERHVSIGWCEAGPFETKRS